MILQMMVPMEIITKDGFTTSRSEIKEVKAFIIRRRPITRISTLNQKYTYEAHYSRVDGQKEFYDNSMYCNNLAVGIIDRKNNPKFKPNKLVFFDDLVEVNEVIL